MSWSRELQDLPHELGNGSRHPHERSVDAALGFALRARRAQGGDEAASWAAMLDAEPELARAVRSLTHGFDEPRGIALALRALHRRGDRDVRDGVRAMLRRLPSDGDERPTQVLAARLLAPSLGPEDRLLVLDPEPGMDAPSLAEQVAEARHPGAETAASEPAVRLDFAQEPASSGELFPDQVAGAPRLLVLTALLGAPARFLPRPPLGSHRAVFAGVTLRKGAVSRLDVAVRALDALEDGGRAVIRLRTTGPLSDQRSLADRRRLLGARAVAAVIELPAAGRGIAPTLLVLAAAWPGAGVLFVRPDEVDEEELGLRYAERFVAFAARAVEAHLAGAGPGAEPGVLAAVIPTETLDTSRALLTPARWLRPSAPSVAEACEALDAAERDEREAAARVERALTALAALR